MAGLRGYIYRETFYILGYIFFEEQRGHIICSADPIIYRSDDDTVQVMTLLNYTGHHGSSEVPRNPLTRWDVSSIPSNGIFLTKKLKN